MKNREPFPQSGWNSRIELLSILVGNTRFLQGLVEENIAYHGDLADLDARLFRPQPSWNLIRTGFQTLLRAYEHDVIRNPNNRNNGIAIMAIASNIQGPWYINRDDLYIWDRSFNFELQMFDGDIQEYGRFRKPK